MDKDFYKILGIDRNTSDEDIRKAYRRLARKYHPDVNPGNKNAEARFKEISEAYQVLGDKEKRKKYDQFGFSAFKTGFDPSNVYSGFGTGFRGFKGFDLNDLIFGKKGSDFSSFGDIFDDMFDRKSRVRYDQSIDGNDLEYNLKLTFDEAITGTIVTINTGREKVKVKIPSGADNGSRIRVPGKGEPGKNGGSDGDLYIITEVAPHKFFKRDGDDIYVELPITVGESAMGAKIEVPTIDGIATMTIPAGTQSGQKFRLKGKGIRSPKGEEKGDQYVVVKIVLPKRLDRKSLSILKEFEEMNKWDPRKEAFK